MPYCTVKLYKGVPMSLDGRDILLFPGRGVAITSFLEPYAITGDVTPYDEDGNYIPFNESMNNILFSPSRGSAPLSGTNGSAKNIDDIVAVNYLKVSLFSRVGAANPIKTLYYFVTNVSISSEMERGTAEKDDAGGFVWRFAIARDVWTTDIWQRSISADDNIKISGGILEETTIDPTTFPNGLSAANTENGKYAAMFYRRSEEETHDGTYYEEAATNELVDISARNEYLVIGFINLGIGDATPGKAMSKKIAVVINTASVDNVGDAVSFIASTNKIIHAIPPDQSVTYETVQVYDIYVVPTWFFAAKSGIPFSVDDENWVFYRESGGYQALPVIINNLTNINEIDAIDVNNAYGIVPPKVFVGDLYNRKEVRRKAFMGTTLPPTSTEDRARTFADEVRLDSIFETSDPSIKVFLRVGESITDLTNDFSVPVPSISETSATKAAEDQAKAFSIFNSAIQAVGGLVTGGLLGGAPGAAAAGLVSIVRGVGETVHAITQKNASPQASYVGGGYAAMNCRKYSGLFYSYEVDTTSQNEEERAFARRGLVSQNGIDMCGIEFHPFRKGSSLFTFYCYSKIRDAEIYAPNYPQFVIDFLKQKFGAGVRIWKDATGFASPDRGSIASQFYGGMTNGNGLITR